MTATTLNPLATARETEATGIERRQAEAIAEGALWRAMRQAADAAAGADRADFAKSRPRRLRQKPTSPESATSYAPPSPDSEPLPAPPSPDSEPLPAPTSKPCAPSCAGCSPFRPRSSSPSPPSCSGSFDRHRRPFRLPGCHHRGLEGARPPFRSPTKGKPRPRRVMATAGPGRTEAKEMRSRAGGRTPRERPAGRCAPSATYDRKAGSSPPRQGTWRHGCRTLPPGPRGEEAPGDGVPSSPRQAKEQYGHFESGISAGLPASLKRSPLANDCKFCPKRRGVAQQ